MQPSIRSLLWRSARLAADTGWFEKKRVTDPISLLAHLPVEGGVRRVAVAAGRPAPATRVGAGAEEIETLLSGKRKSLLTLGVAGALWRSSSACSPSSLFDRPWPGTVRTDLERDWPATAN